MNDQLVLLDEDEVDEGNGEEPTPPLAHWRLDEHTREVGRRGVALAREALRQAATATRAA